MDLFRLGSNIIADAFIGAGTSKAFLPYRDEGFTVRLEFSTDAVALVTLTRSADGQNFSPLMAGPNIISAVAPTLSTMFLNVASDPATSWRLESSLTAGRASYVVGRGMTLYAPTDRAILNLPAASHFTGPTAPPPTTAQIQQLFQTKWAPLADNDIAGDLTGWKVVASNAIVKLTIPAAAQRRKASSFRLGSNRELWAEYADVVAVMDGSGNAIAKASSGNSPTISYVPGARITSGDLKMEPTGLLFHATLIEAATCHISMTDPLPNLTALGA